MPFSIGYFAWACYAWQGDGAPTELTAAAPLARTTGVAIRTPDACSTWSPALTGAWHD